MVQGCEQAAFATEHQIWDPSRPVPRSLQEGDVDAIRAQLQGDHMEGNRRSLESRIATGAAPRMASVPLEYIAGLGFPSGHKFLSALQLADGATFRKVCATWTSMATPRPDLKGWNEEVLEKAVERAEAALNLPAASPS